MKCSYSYCKHPAIWDVMNCWGTVMSCCGEHFNRLVTQMSGPGGRLVTVGPVGTLSRQAPGKGLT